MKFPDKIGIVAASLILAIALAAPAFAGHGNFAQRQVNQAIRAQQRQNHHHNQQIVFVPVQQQQFRYVPAQNFAQPVYAPQQFNAGCNNGALQFNAGCQSLYR